MILAEIKQAIFTALQVQTTREVERWIICKDFYYPCGYRLGEDKKKWEEALAFVQFMKKEGEDESIW